MVHTFGAFLAGRTLLQLTATSHPRRRSWCRAMFGNVIFRTFECEAMVWMEMRTSRKIPARVKMPEVAHTVRLGGGNIDLPDRARQSCKNRTKGRDETVESERHGERLQALKPGKNRGKAHREKAHPGEVVDREVLECRSEILERLAYPFRKLEHAISRV